MEAEKKDLQVQVEFLELQGKQLEHKTKNYSEQSEWTETPIEDLIENRYLEHIRMNIQQQSPDMGD